jgi:zinc transporter, ZIP family
VLGCAGAHRQGDGPHLPADNRDGLSNTRIITRVLAALGWGMLAAASLVIGAFLGLVRKWKPGTIGAVLGFGAGALISSVAFELAEEGIEVGGLLAVAVGLGVGALVFFLADQAVTRMGGRSGGESEGLPLALGALLDGIPEQAVLGIGLAGGEGVSVALLLAVFVSNLPEAIGSSSDMAAAGKPHRSVLMLWAAVAVLCALATLGGYVLADVAAPGLRAGINGFAAGALLVMLVDSMIPEANTKAKDWAGLATVLGFALATGLSALS